MINAKSWATFLFLGAFCPSHRVTLNAKIAYNNVTHLLTREHFILIK